MKRSLLIALLICSTALLAEDKVDKKSPVKVFVLAGQSNMQGHGRIQMGKEGDLEHAAKLKDFAFLKDAEGWRERDDV